MSNNGHKIELPSSIVVRDLAQKIEKSPIEIIKKLMTNGVMATINPRAAEQRSPFNTDFDALQLRVLGQMPFIQNSFFLLSMRAEKTPRLTFATFQIPIKNGHYFNINSGVTRLTQPRADPLGPQADDGRPCLLCLQRVRAG